MPTTSTCGSAPAWSTIAPRRPRGRARRRRRGSRTTRWCSPPAASRRAADPRPGPRRRPARRARARVPHLDDCLRLDARGAARRADARWWSAAGCSAWRPPGPGRRGLAVEVVRGRRAPDAQPARRRRPARSWPATCAGSATTVYTGARATRLDRRRAASSTTATCSTPTWSCSPPAAARPPPSRRRAGLEVRRGVVVDDQLRTSDPPSTRSATAPSTTARSPGWSRPPGSRPRCSPRHLTGERTSPYDGARTGRPG